MFILAPVRTLFVHEIELGIDSNIGILTDVVISLLFSSLLVAPAEQIYLNMKLSIHSKTILNRGILDDVVIALCHMAVRLYI